MKLIIFGGFLGSGKTSILIQLARYLVGEEVDSASKVVIVENEIGEVGIDDKVLRSGGYEVKGMFSGCVCCTMSGELVLNIKQILDDLHPDFLIMEATGVAYPANIKETLEGLKLDTKTLSVVDAKRWKRLLKPMGMLIQGQLEGADMILINKIDAVDEETLATVEESVRSFNETAELHPVSANSTIDETIFEKLVS